MVPLGLPGCRKGRAGLVGRCRPARVGGWRRSRQSREAQVAQSFRFCLSCPLGPGAGPAHLPATDLDTCISSTLSWVSGVRCAPHLLGPYLESGPCWSFPRTDAPDAGPPFSQTPAKCAGLQQGHPAPPYTQLKLVLTDWCLSDPLEPQAPGPVGTWKQPEPSWPVPLQLQTSGTLGLRSGCRGGPR